MKKLKPIRIAPGRSHVHSIEVIPERRAGVWALHLSVDADAIVVTHIPTGGAAYRGSRGLAEKVYVALVSELPLVGRGMKPMERNAGPIPASHPLHRAKAVIDRARAT